MVDKNIESYVLQKIKDCIDSNSIGIDKNINYLESYYQFVASKLNKETEYSSDETVKKYVELFTNVGLCVSLNKIDIDSFKSTIDDFGFTSCFLPIQTIILFELWVKNNKSRIGESTEKIAKDIFQQLVSKERNIAFESYLQDTQYYEKDLKLLYDILDTDTYYSDDETLRSKISKMREVILTQPVYLADKSTLNTTLKDILLQRYKYILAAEFDGIEKYKGVLGKNDENLFLLSVVREKESGVAQNTLQEITHSYTEILNKIQSIISQFDTDVVYAKNSAHQFNLEEIYENGKNNYITYYPYKILELVAKCKFTFKSAQIYYSVKNKADTSSFQTYFDKIVYPSLKQVMDSYIYYVLSRYVLETKNVDANDKVALEKEILYTLNDNYNFGDGDKNIGSHAVQLRNINSSEFYLTNVFKHICSFINSVSTCIVLADYKDAEEFSTETNMSLGYTVCDFRLKFCMPNTNDKLNLSTKSFVEDLKFLSEFSQGYKENFDASGNEIKNKLNCEYIMKDIAYTPNYTKTNALPLFAYKALMGLQDKVDNPSDVKLSWSHILLGRDDQNNIVYSGEGINLHQTGIHFMIAGSRSGKGVMSYNLLASAISDSIPLFYMDGKPDTAIALRKLSRSVKGEGDDEIFCVDNRTTAPKLDTENLFQNRKFNIPSYLQCKNDSKLWGVISYYRGIMLCNAMALYAVQNDSSPIKDQSKFLTLWKQTAGKKGLLLVLDEINNYLTAWKEYFGNQGKIINTAMTTLALDKVSKIGSNMGSLNSKITQANSAVERAKLNLDKAKSENKKDISKLEEALQKAEDNLKTSIENLQDSQASLEETSLESLYWGNFYESIKKSNVKLLSAARANKFQSKIQYLIIGQMLDEIENSLQHGSIEFTDNKTIGVSKDAKLTDLVSWFNHIILTMPNGLDIIFGYNKDRTSYAGVDNSPIMKAHLSAIKRGWVYHSLTVDTVKNFFMDVKKAGTNPREEYKMFRPYLILNDAITPQAKFLPDYAKGQNGEKGKLTQGEMANLDEMLKIIADREEIGGDGQYVAQCLSNVECAFADYTRGSDEAPKNPLGFYQAWRDFNRDNAPINGFENGSSGDKLHSGLGLEGYMNMLNPNAVKDMQISGKLAQAFIEEVYNYNGTWMEFLDDMRPEYTINLTAIGDIPKETLKYSFETALPVFSATSVRQLVVKTYKNYNNAVSVLGEMCRMYFTDTNTDMDKQHNEDMQPNETIKVAGSHGGFESNDEPQTTTTEKVFYFKDIKQQLITRQNIKVALTELGHANSNYLKELDTYLASNYTEPIPQNNVSNIINTLSNKIMQDYKNLKTQQTPKPQAQPIQTKVADNTTTTQTEQTQTKPQTQVQDTNIEMQLKIDKICTLVMAGMVNSGIRVSKNELVHTLYTVITERLGNVTTEEYLLNFFRMLV